ncbi:hypothetical protein [Streptomyces sp. NPDC005525]|uniref:MmyB family transcriptional regulator n=1 Tax=Streptomyces sp. NPDC005525 TaxID=3364720 RepID=UPI003691A2F0
MGASCRPCDGVGCSVRRRSRCGTVRPVSRWSSDGLLPSCAAVVVAEGRAGRDVGVRARPASSPRYRPPAPDAISRLLQIPAKPPSCPGLSRILWTAPRTTQGQHQEHPGFPGRPPREDHPVVGALPAYDGNGACPDGPGGRCGPAPRLLPRLGRLPEHHSLLRTEAGRTPHDSDLTVLIGELVTRSEEFRTAWAKHEVCLHHTGRKVFRHPEIGEVALDFDAMELPAQPGLTLTAYSAEPHTPADDAPRPPRPPGPRPRTRLRPPRRGPKSSSPDRIRSPISQLSAWSATSPEASRLSHPLCARPRGAGRAF